MSHQLTRDEANIFYCELLANNDLAAMAHLAKEDLFFLLTIVCNKRHIDNEWGYNRCREVESDPYGYVDCWAREHYKSTILTFGLILSDVINNPEETHCIVSHVKPMSKAFFDELRREIEENSMLQDLYPTIFSKKLTDYPTWSEEKGLTVLRKSNRKEPTIGISGLTDGMATGMHYDKLHYDDIVVVESVRTSDSMAKTEECFRLSLNIGAIGGKVSVVGTRYHFGDLLGKLIEEGSFKPRVYTATQTGRMVDENGVYVGGTPVLMPVEVLLEKYKRMGSYVFSCQMMQNPVSEENQTFKRHWIQYWDTMPNIRNGRRFLVVDPSEGKGENSDFTSMWVVCYMTDDHWYILDGCRERLNLTQRAERVMLFAQKYRVEIVGYEKYGMQSDIEYIQKVMDREGERFTIKQLGGIMSKEDRIRRLVPKFETSQIIMPRSLTKIDYKGNKYDLIKTFIDLEYMRFPMSKHDDSFDCLARIVDLGVREQKCDNDARINLQSLPRQEKCKNFYKPY